MIHKYTPYIQLSLQSDSFTIQASFFLEIKQFIILYLTWKDSLHLQVKDPKSITVNELSVGEAK